MPIVEASKRFDIDIEKLKKYEKIGLLDFNTFEKDNKEEEHTQRIMLVHRLSEMGMASDMLKQYIFSRDNKNKSDSIRILRKFRSQLLDNLHDRQKQLDYLDYMLYEINQDKKLFEEAKWKTYTLLYYFYYHSMG